MIILWDMIYALIVEKNLKKIRDKYNEKYEELEKQRIKIEEEKEQELKEIGINNELPL